RRPAPPRGEVVVIDGLAAQIARNLHQAVEMLRRQWLFALRATLHAVAHGNGDSHGVPHRLACCWLRVEGLWTDKDGLVRSLNPQPSTPVRASNSARPNSRALKADRPTPHALS